MCGMRFDSFHKSFPFLWRRIVSLIAELQSPWGDNLHCIAWSGLSIGTCFDWGFTERSRNGYWSQDIPRYVLLSIFVCSWQGAGVSGIRRASHRRRLAHVAGSWCRCRVITIQISDISAATLSGGCLNMIDGTMY